LATRPSSGRPPTPCAAPWTSRCTSRDEAFIRSFGGRIRNKPSADKRRACPVGSSRGKSKVRFYIAIRGIEGQIEQGDSFLNDRFPDLKANYILANPPFNIRKIADIYHAWWWDAGADLVPAQNKRATTVKRMLLTSTEFMLLHPRSQMLDLDYLGTLLLTNSFLGQICTDITGSHWEQTKTEA